MTSRTRRGASTSSSSAAQPSDSSHPKTRGENNNFGPRIGLAWDVRNDGKDLVRAAYGRFYQYISGGSLRAEADTLKQNTITIPNPSYPDPYGGLSPTAFIRANARP